jgi:hypothetical protein
MKYSLIEITIRDLVDLIERKKVDLNPSYQRNFIWSPDDQKDLIDTILLGWALPNFFMYQKPNGSFEMVDGQQRSKTIYRFVIGLITSSKTTGNLLFKNSNQSQVLDYKLPFILITDIQSDDVLRNFYVLINKKGKHLNPAEVQRSEFYDTNFMALANEILTNQNLINLNLFTDATSKRLNDRDFIQELLGYLKSGVKDKKNHIKNIFERDIDEDEYQELKMKFERVIDIIQNLNLFKPLRKTRYKQKNDFYTLFSFISENQDEDKDLLLYQYKVLLLLDQSDNEGKQFIRPTNERCIALKKYAENCVTQSNSKNARDKRYEFFEDVLKNQDSPPNDTLINVIEFLEDIYGENIIDIKLVDKYYLLDMEPLIQFI